ncbi:hypothetical protein PORY_000690 [Pneumocystis oryctolagi]|uniref:Uncharacterized protein n=1 Tax=Pneumocystis oryctolagi TaxID=42067 RepID=A0ACB7CE42_9ASCO|nr:hypothetical protein PORY_000690 [Pneumocystis oryctolagi]
MAPISYLVKEPLFSVDLEQLIQTWDQPLHYFQLKDNLNNQGLTPKTDISESSQYYIVEVELPGFKKEDLSLELINETTILIEGSVKKQINDKFIQNIPTTENITNNDTSIDNPTCVKNSIKNNSKKTHQITCWHKERSFGKFSRSISFPTSIDKDNIKTSLENGLLCIIVPKPASLTPKKIMIN